MGLGGGGVREAAKYNNKPPDKGSFPLDHDGECKSDKEAFMKCLADNNGVGRACRLLSKQYLECRMSRDLMSKESVQNLGFVEPSEQTKE